MSNLIEKKFINQELGIELKSFIDQQQNIFFIGKDVAKILGYHDSNQAIRKHVDKEDRKYFPVETTGYSKRRRPPIILNESGFYSLVLSSKLETAKKFKRWVTSEVLPAIRKFGYYKLFDPRLNQRVVIDGKKFYKHQVFSNYAANKNGEVINVKTGRNIKTSKSSNEYLTFKIYNEKLEKPYTYSHHRFVYEVFKGPIPKCLQIDHRNSIRNDNRIKNLQLLTPIKNIQKSLGKPIISISITTGEERKFNCIKKASIELDINKSTISNICCKRKYYKTSRSNKDGKNTLSSLWISFNIILILKPGFYELVVRSKLETAKMFR